MEDPIKKIKIRKTFKDIFFRAIVYDILPFVQMDAESWKEKKRKEFDFFGYFRKDRQRKIFFLFSSLYIITHSNVIIDITRIISLNINIMSINPAQRNDLRRKILNNTDKLKKCERFFLDCRCSKLSEIYFIKSNSFPSIKHFRIDSYYRSTQFQVDPEILDETSEMWKRLESLEIHTERNISQIPNFVENGGLQNLKTISLCPDFLPPNYTLNLPKIENIHIENSKKNNTIRITHQRRIKKISFCNSLNILKKLLETPLPDLEEISFYHREIFFFQSSQLPVLDFLGNDNFRRIRRLGLHNVIFPENAKNIRFSNNLEYLNLENIKCFNEKMLEHEYPRLRSICISGISSFIGNSIYKWTKNIEEIELSDLKNFDFNFFSVNYFENLRKLKLDQLDLTSIKEGIWMDNLRKLRIGNSILLESMFVGRGFRMLKELDIRRSTLIPCLVRKKWKINSENLLDITFENTKNFNIDTFFRENVFRSLIGLGIWNFKGCTGTGWGKMGNLEIMDLNLYPFEDHFFQNQKLEKLHSLTIAIGSDNPGDGWNYLPSLKCATFYVPKYQLEEFKRKMEKCCPKETKMYHNVYYRKIN